MKCIFDTESDGFLEQCTTIHCAVFKDIDTLQVHKFRPHEIPRMLEFMDGCERLIGHNCIGHDFPVFI